MKNLVFIAILVSLFACKRNDDLPFSAVSGRVAMNDNSGRHFQLNIKEGSYTEFNQRWPIRWSHDGSRLMTVDYATGESYCSIIDANTQAEILRFKEDNYSGYCWSPNDDEIAYLNVYDSSIVRLNLHTLEKRIIRLPSSNFFYGEMDWSTDGNSFVFIGRDLNSNEASLCRIGADGTNYKVLATGVIAHPRWSPDDMTIAFDDAFNIFFIQPDGSNKRVAVEKAEHPCWSSDGSILMFTFIEELGWNSSKIDIRAREMGGEHRERVVYENCALLDWNEER